MRQKLEDLGWYALGCVLFGAVLMMMVDACFHDLDREDKIKECMYEQSACEYARCSSMVDDVPMTEEEANACP
jgi:hypothetical protein